MLHVLPTNKHFVVRSSHSRRALKRFEFCSEASAYAERIAKGRQTTVVWHRADGTVLRKRDFSKKKAVEKVAASVHIYNAPEMTKKGRREIAAWLRKHADWLLKEGDNYAKSFRGRYFYEAAQ